MAPDQQAIAGARQVAAVRFYHGWYVAGVCFVALLMSWGVMYYALTFFIRPMTADLGWSVAQFALVYTINSVLWGLAAPLFGGYVDRHGVRTVMLAGSLGTAATFIAMAYVSSLPVFYLLLGGLGAVSMALMGGFVAVAIASWFVRLRGRALGFVSVGSPMGGVLLAPLSAVLIESIGWRMVWLLYGALILAFVTLPALFLKRRPEDLGLYPDGGDRPPVVVEGGADEATWSRRQAMRTACFWLIVLGFAINYLAVGGVMVHLAPFMASKALTQPEIAVGAFIFAIGAIVVKPVTGFLLEAVPARFVGSASVLLSAVALLLMLALQGPLLYGGLFLYALAFGGFFPIEEMLWASSFGRRSLGTVRSLAFPLTISLGSSGPLIGGLLFDATGSYAAAFWLFIITYLLAAVFLAFARSPRAQLAAAAAHPAATPAVHTPARRLNWSPRPPLLLRGSLALLAVLVLFAMVTRDFLLSGFGRQSRS